MYVCHTFITWRYIYVCVPYVHNLEIYIVRVPYVHNLERYICMCAIRSKPGDIYMYVCHTFITWRYIYVCVPYVHNLEIYIYVCVPYVHNLEIYICMCAIRS